MGGFTLTATGRYGQAMQVTGSAEGTVVAQTSVVIGGETFVYTSQMGSDAIDAWRKRCQPGSGYGALA